MECLLGSTPTIPAIVRPPISLITKRSTNFELRAILSGVNEDDPLLETAISNSSLRFQETLKPESLLVDSYAGCLAPHNVVMHKNDQSHPYCVATKFIDDKLLSTMKDVDGLNQVVLFTDGMDTRPYRLKWPNSTLIFDISPERVFTRAALNLKDVGAEVQRSCLLLHIPVESSDLQHHLQSKGFNGNRPSIWVFQGLSLSNIASFEEVLVTVSSLAMKGCLLLGDLPDRYAETKVQLSRMEQMDKLFMRHGFRVQVVDFNKVAESLCTKLDVGEYKNVLFVAEQLRFSDDQMETWRNKFQRIENDGDEDGFDEL